MAINLNTNIHPRTPYPGHFPQQQGQQGQSPARQAYNAGKDTVEVLRQAVRAFRNKEERQKLKALQQKAGQGQATMEDFRETINEFPLETRALMDLNEMMAQNLTPTQRDAALQEANLAARWMYGALANLQSVPPEKRAQRYGQIMRHVATKTDWGKTEMGQKTIANLMAMTTLGAEGLDDSVLARSMMAVTAIGEGLDDLKGEMTRSMERQDELADVEAEREYESGQAALDRKHEGGLAATKRAHASQEGQLDRESRERIASMRGGGAGGRSDLMEALGEGEGAAEPSGDNDIGSRLDKEANETFTVGTVEGNVLHMGDKEGGEKSAAPESKKKEPKEGDIVLGEKIVVNSKKYQVTQDDITQEDMVPGAIAGGGGGYVRDKKTGVRFRLTAGQINAVKKGDAKIRSLDDGLYLQIRDRKIKLQAG